MDIAMISSWRVKCGIASYTENLSKALANLDHRVYIVRLHRWGRRSREYFETLATRRIPKCALIHVQHEFGLFDRGEAALYVPLKNYHELTPLVSTMHATGNIELDSVVYDMSDMVIVHNEYCLRRLDREAKVVPHGCEPRKPEPLRESKEKLGLDPDKAVVTLFGFIGPYKNYELAIRVMGLEFPDVQLLIGGGWHVETDTPYIQGLRQMAENLCPGQSKWLGWIPDEALPTVFGASDVCLYPNKFMSESGALLTMMGFGKPILSSALAPNREKEAQGALVCFENEQDLVKKLERMLTDPELRGKCEAGAWSYAEKNSWANIAKRHLELYEELL